MNRLTDIYNGTLHSQIVYDPLGRMTAKQADGLAVFANASFDAAPGQPAQPHAMKSAETAEGVFPAAQQQITYTAFDKVKSISEDGNGLIVTYGYDQQRIRSYLMTSDNRFLNKDYVGVCEYNTEYFVDGGAIQTTFTYLVGPYGVFAVVEKGNNSESIHYILKDHLGSWTSITDSEGNVEQEISFDAWGNLRDPETWLNYPTDETTLSLMFDRGFTGHEHMTTFGLINMNGRCYDPLTSSFLSVDAYVQSPTNAQSFNRYAYCQNNPLRYVDPSGWYMQGASYGTPITGSSWGTSYSQHAYEPRELGMLQLPENKVMTWWMEGDNMLGGGGGGGGGGHTAATQLQLIRNWLSNPCEKTNMAMVNAGITKLTIGVVNGQVDGQDGYRNSFYYWIDALNNAHSAQILFEYIGGNENNYFSVSNYSPELYHQTITKTIDRIGVLPLASENNCSSLQQADYKMVYNVVTNSNSTIFVNAISYNTIVIDGKVRPTAKATLVHNGHVLDSKPLLYNGEAMINNIGADFVGSAIFNIQESGNYSIIMQGGWTVSFYPSGSFVPMSRLHGFPINANATIPILIP